MDGTMDWESMVLEGLAARKQYDTAQWTLGDLALRVETRYGEGDLARYAEAISIDYSRLKHYKSAAGAFEKAQRRANLSYSHHEALGSREDRHEWLAKAASDGWSVRQMLSEVEKHDDERRQAHLAQQTQATLEGVPGYAEEVLDKIDKEGSPAAMPTIVEGGLPSPDDDDALDNADDDGDEGEDQRDDAWDETEPGRKRDNLAPWPLANERNITWANAARRRFSDRMSYLSGMMWSLPQAEFGRIAAVATDEDYKIWHGI
jgi:hypothetical protein